MIDLDRILKDMDDDAKRTNIGDAILNFQCIGMPGTFCPAWCRGCFARALWRKWWLTTPAGKATK